MASTWCHHKTLALDRRR